MWCTIHQRTGRSHMPWARATSPIELGACRGTTRRQVALQHRCPPGFRAARSVTLAREGADHHGLDCAAKRRRPPTPAQPEGTCRERFAGPGSRWHVWPTSQPPRLRSRSSRLRRARAVRSVSTRAPNAGICRARPRPGRSHQRTGARCVAINSTGVSPHRQGRVPTMIAQNTGGRSSSPVRRKRSREQRTSLRCASKHGHRLMTSLEGSWARTKFASKRSTRPVSGNQ